MESIYQAIMNVEGKLQARVKGLSQDHLSWRPQENSWSILDVAGHLVDTDRDYWNKKARLVAAKDGVAPHRQFDQDQLVKDRGYNQMTLDQVLTLLRESRRELIELYRSIPETAWGNKGFLWNGICVLRDFPPSIVRHDDSHMGQIDRVKHQLKKAGLL